MKNSAILVVLLGLAAPAAAQPVPRDDLETVIVTAPRIAVTPNAKAHEFIRSVAVPSVLLGEIPRWRRAICPRTDGLSRSELTSFVTERIRTVAALAGVPLAPTPCKPNIQVIFTSEPQTALDTLHAKNPELLGYRGAVTVSHPVQAWYQTGIQDSRGQVFRDEDATLALDFSHNCSGCQLTLFTGSTNTAPVSNVGGWRDHPDLTSDILGVIIIADAAQTGSHKLGAIADYAALLALSQSPAYETCQGVASVANEMSPGCADALKPDAIAPSDIGFLRGIYRMDAGASLQVQQDQIAAEMAKSLKGGL